MKSATNSYGRISISDWDERELAVGLVSDCGEKPDAPPLAPVIELGVDRSDDCEDMVSMGSPRPLVACK